MRGKEVMSNLAPPPPATLLWLTALARLPDQKDTLSKRLNNVNEYHF